MRSGAVRTVPYCTVPYCTVAYCTVPYGADAVACSRPARQTLMVGVVACSRPVILGMGPLPAGKCCGNKQRPSIRHVMAVGAVRALVRWQGILGLSDWPVAPNSGKLLHWLGMGVGRQGCGWQGCGWQGCGDQSDSGVLRPRQCIGPHKRTVWQRRGIPHIDTSKVMPKGCSCNLRLWLAFRQMSGPQLQLSAALKSTHTCMHAYIFTSQTGGPGRWQIGFSDALWM